MAGNRGLAEQIRVGLEDEEEITVISLAAKDSRGTKDFEAYWAGIPRRTDRRDPLDELWFQKPIRTHILEFGVVFCLLGAIVANFLLWKGAHPGWALAIVTATTGLLALARFAPRAARPLWKGWMRVAEILSFIVTGTILTVTWVAMLTPMSALLRVLGIKVMDLSYGTGQASYWEDRDPKQDAVALFKNQY